MARQAGHWLQGLPSTGDWQHMARDSILAQVVFPVPLVPVKRYAWDILPVRTCSASEDVTLACPTTSENVFGLYFL